MFLGQISYYSPFQLKLNIELMTSTTNMALMMALPSESQGLFEQQQIDVHYSGIGKVNAAFKAYQVIMQTGCTTLLNLGTAGSHIFDAHELVEVTRFVQRDMDVSALGFEIGVTPMDDHCPSYIDLEANFPQLRKGICGTGDNFATTISALDCNLVDMEGYAIAKVCKKLGVNLISVKYISDGANQQAHIEWQDNLLLGAKKLLALYQDIKS